MDFVVTQMILTGVLIIGFAVEDVFGRVGRAEWPGGVAGRSDSGKDP
ncbi:MAG: hypothetical protein ACRETZ_09760 [Steroidobacteraceae bacterium]